MTYKTFVEDIKIWLSGTTNLVYIKECLESEIELPINELGIQQFPAAFITPLPFSINNDNLATYTCRIYLAGDVGLSPIMNSGETISKRFSTFSNLTKIFQRFLQIIPDNYNGIQYPITANPVILWDSNVDGLYFDISLITGVECYIDIETGTSNPIDLECSGTSGTSGISGTSGSSGSSGSSGISGTSGIDGDPGLTGGYGGNSLLYSVLNERIPTSGIIDIKNIEDIYINGYDINNINCNKWFINITNGTYLRFFQENLPSNFLIIKVLSCTDIGSNIYKIIKGDTIVDNSNFENGMNLVITY